jgi:hypothetical protein
MQTEWVSTGERVKIYAAFMSAGRKWSGYADLWSESVFCARFESSQDDDGRVSIGEEINHCRAVTFVSLKKNSHGEGMSNDHNKNDSDCSARHITSRVRRKRAKKRDGRRSEKSYHLSFI